MKFVFLDHLPPNSQLDSSVRSEERHFDLMFEVPDNEKLRTYACVMLPEEAGLAVDFIQLANHRAEYLSYEGPVPNNRGVVERFAFGNWRGELDAEVTLTFSNESSTFASQVWKIRFESAQLLRVV